MKKIGLLLSLVAVLLTVSSVLATGSLPGSGWWSGEQVQNIGTGQATVSITAYDSAGANTFTAQNTIDEGSSKTWLPGNFSGMSSGFMGGAIVSSDQPIRAITNITNLESAALGLGVSGGYAAAQYQGMATVDTTIYFPVAKNDYYDNTTTFYIQNAGSSAATALATFYAGGSTYTFTTPSIEPGDMVVVSPSDASMPSGDTDGFGALVVTSAQPIAGVVMEHATSENPSTYLASTRGFIESDANAQAFAPIIKNNFSNRYTTLYVMNTNTSGNIDVTVTYKKVKRCEDGSGLDTWTDTISALAPGAAHAFVHSTGQTNLPEGSDGCLATATIDATGGEVVAIVKEGFTDTYLAVPNQEAIVYYSALSADASTTKISLPLYKEASRRKYSGIQVQNVSASSANIVLVFAGSGGTYTSTVQTINSGEGLTFFDLRNRDASFWDGTAMTATSLGCDTTPDCKANGVIGVTITSDQNIIAVVNESPYPWMADPSNILIQDKNNYEGFNLIP